MLHRCTTSQAPSTTAGTHQLGEGGQQALDADAAHLHKLPRHQRCREGEDWAIWQGIAAGCQSRSGLQQQWA